MQAQLLIYVGGTLVLLVFGVMLTASGPYLKIATSPGETILGAVVALLFLCVVVASVSGVTWPEPAAADAGTLQTAAGNTLRPLGLAFLGLDLTRTWLTVISCLRGICCHLKLFRFTCWWC